MLIKPAYIQKLPHDANGRVDPAAFATFQTALNGGKPSDCEKIVMGGVRKLNGPKGGLAFDLSMMDSVQFDQPQVPPAPPLASDQGATELLEHYWASLLRDVAFADYGSSTLAVQAAAELGSQPIYLGARDSRGQVTPALLFRGAFPGESLGPHISQFLLQPASLGTPPMVQQQRTYLPQIDYATDFVSWLDIQNCVDTGKRNQPDRNSATAETAGTSGQSLMSMCCFRSTSSLFWCLPESMPTLPAVSPLLSQAFPEGAPAHPSYPTGHGAVAGACITVLKFFFDGSFVVPNPVVSSSDGLTLARYAGADAGQLTVNGELNKLGHNVSFGHGIHAGIHWRSDTDASLLLGEAVALSFLRDRARCYNEPFTVSLTRFDGSIATVSNQ